MTPLNGARTYSEQTKNRAGLALGKRDQRGVIAAKKAALKLKEIYSEMRSIRSHNESAKSFRSICINCSYSSKARSLRGKST